MHIYLNTYLKFSDLYLAINFLYQIPKCDRIQNKSQGGDVSFNGEDLARLSKVDTISVKINANITF